MVDGGGGNAAVSPCAQQSGLGYAQGDDEPELYNQTGSVMGSRVQIAVGASA